MHMPVGQQQRGPHLAGANRIDEGEKPTTADGSRHSRPASDIATDRMMAALSLLSFFFL